MLLKRKCDSKTSSAAGSFSCRFIYNWHDNKNTLTEMKNEYHREHPLHPKRTSQLLSHRRTRGVDDHRHGDAVQRETHAEIHRQPGTVRSEDQGLDFVTIVTFIMEM